MGIDFLAAECTSVTNEKIFGIYDIPPAALEFINDSVWIAWVDNENEKEIIFTAIDKCLNIPRNEGERCEAMIRYDNTLIFIELKDCDGGRWAGKARDQLANTISLFKRDMGLNGFQRLYSYIANKQRPNFKSGGKNFSQQFEDETGFILRVSNVIKIA